MSGLALFELQLDFDFDSNLRPPFQATIAGLTAAFLDGC